MSWSKMGIAATVAARVICRVMLVLKNLTSEHLVCLSSDLTRQR